MKFLNKFFKRNKKTKEDFNLLIDLIDIKRLLTINVIDNETALRIIEEQNIHTSLSDFYIDTIGNFVDKNGQLLPKGQRILKPLNNFDFGKLCGKLGAGSKTHFGMTRDRGAYSLFPFFELSKQKEILDPKRTLIDLGIMGNGYKTYGDAARENKTMKKGLHVLKTEREYFQQQLDGIKNFEIRKNDRFFEVGDYLLLKEIDLEQTNIGENINIYTGRNLLLKIITISDYKQLKDYVVLGTKNVSESVNAETIYQLQEEIEIVTGTVLRKRNNFGDVNRANGQIEGLKTAQSIILGTL